MGGEVQSDASHLRSTGHQWIPRSGHAFESATHTALLVLMYITGMT